MTKDNLIINIEINSFSSLLRQLFFIPKGSTRLFIFVRFPLSYSISSHGIKLIPVHL